MSVVKPMMARVVSLNGVGNKEGQFDVFYCYISVSSFFQGLRKEHSALLLEGRYEECALQFFAIGYRFEYGS